MQLDKLPGNCISRGNLTLSSFSGLNKHRKRCSSPLVCRRYVKQRYSPLKNEDIMEVDIQPTHYLRLVFPDHTQWHCRSGHTIDEVNHWLSAFGDVQLVKDHHITLALLSCTQEDLNKDLTPLGSILKNVKFDVGSFYILQRTLVLHAKELSGAYGHTMFAGLAVLQIEEWLRSHGFNQHHTELPLHMSVAKLQNLSEIDRAFLSSRPYIQQYTTRFFLAPTELQLVTLRASNNGLKEIVKRIPVHHDDYSWW
nr:MAG: nonstructural protein [Merbecovirus sp. PaGB01]